MADRIVIMKDGEIRQVGTPEEVYRAPADTFVASFIGAPSMNMLAASADGGRVTLGSGKAVPLRTDASGGMLLGVRPDDLRIAGVGEKPLVEGVVTVREPLGHETLIYVDAGGQEIVAKADGRRPPAVGARVALSAAAETLHLFDAGTGRTVVVSPAALAVA